MENHLLEYIEIKDFKCFKDFKAEGFKRVNLIGGKNNVGKTAFMEAIFLIDNIKNGTDKFFSALMTTESLRKEIPNPLTNEIFLKTLLSHCPLQLAHQCGNKIELRYEDNEIKYDIVGEEKKLKSLNDKVNPSLFIHYLANFISNNVNNKILQELYNGVKLKRKREELNKLLNVFDSDLIEVDIINDEVKVFSESMNTWDSIFDYGDGLKYYLAFVSALWSYDNSIIFIDEIENGIHYSKLDDLWNIILTISKELNVQVFITTHSKECIESYARVSKKLEDEDITYIKMSKLKDGSLYAGVRQYDVLENTLDQDHEIR